MTLTTISILLNLLLLGILFLRRSKGNGGTGSVGNNPSVKKHFSWQLDSSRRIKLMGEMDMDFDADAVMAQRRANPFASPRTDFQNKERLHEMYYYMLSHPETLANSAKIVQYINRLCSQRGISELDKLQFVLDFVQEPNIKYILDGESKELAGAIQYIRFPDETLFDGHGDCDCKSFLAATLYHLMGYSVLYLLSQKLQHAAICIEYDKRWGTNLHQQSNMKDVTVEVNGQWYIFCETTSDGFRIGGISSRQSINDFDTMLELRA